MAIDHFRAAGASLTHRRSGLAAILFRKQRQKMTLANAAADDGRADAWPGGRGWIISDGKAGNDVQTRGVFDALGLAYEVKPVDPTGIWQALSPWGPVNPAERFGTRGEPVPCRPGPISRSPSGRLTTPYIRRLKQLAGLATYTIILQNPKVGAKCGGPVLGARARHAARPQRHHHADGAAQLHARRLAELRAQRAADDIAALPRPRVAVLLGGPNGDYRYTPPRRWRTWAARCSRLRGSARG